MVREQLAEFKEGILALLKLLVNSNYDTPPLMAYQAEALAACRPFFEYQKECCLFVIRKVLHSPFPFQLPLSLPLPFRFLMSEM